MHTHSHYRHRKRSSLTNTLVVLTVNAKKKIFQILLYTPTSKSMERSASKQPPELQHRPAGVYIVSAERNMRICIDTLLMKMLYDGRPYCPRSH